MTNSIYVPQGRYHTIPEVAIRFDVTRMTVNNWLLQKRLVGVKTPIGWLVEATQLERFKTPRVGRPGKK